MAVHIRLRRVGKRPKKRTHFRITVIDQRRPRDGRFIEEIGFYDPSKKPPYINIKRDRYEFWVKKGAKPSDTVKNLVNNIQQSGG